MTSKETAELSPAEKIFRRLPGMWQLTRKVGTLGVFEGHARFSATHARTLRYREDGVLRQASGPNLEGFREFDFRLMLDSIAVDFVEDHRRGCRYVDLRFDPHGPDLIAQAIHTCPPDAYTHRMTWRADGSFEVVVEAQGPAKRYRLVTTYERASSSRR